MFGDEVERLQHFDPLTGELIVDDLEHVAIWPATHYNVKEGTMERAVGEIGRELNARTASWRPRASCSSPTACASARSTTWRCCARSASARGSRTTRGSSTGGPPGARPYCLIDYFPKDFVCFIDESHQTVPQIGGMYEGDRSRKSTLVDFGFRLPSAMDNRPQTFQEFLSITPQLVYVSGHAGPYEREHSGRSSSRSSARRDRRPRGRGARDAQPDRRPDEEIRARSSRNERTLVTTLTKKMSEDLTDYLLEMGFKVRYLHSEIDTLERIQIIRELRLGEYDVLVGVNLPARGAWTCPRSRWSRSWTPTRRASSAGRTSLIQTIGARRATSTARSSCTPTRRPDGDAHGRSTRPTAARDPARVQRGARHHAGDDRQGHLRHLGVPDVGLQGAAQRPPRREKRSTWSPPRSRRRSSSSRRRCSRRRGAALRVRGQAARRDPRAAAATCQEATAPAEAP
jgi:excinuclease ABC subunit B